MTTTATTPATEVPAKLPRQYCHAVLQKFERHAEEPPADGGKPARRVYRIQISNDTPFERYGEMWILGHKESEIDLSYAENGLAFWLEHGGPGAPRDPDPRMHLGIVNNFSLENGALWGDAEFAEDDALDPIALRVKRDWESEHPTRRYISAGQQPIDYVLKSSQAQGEMSQRRWVLWQLREVSIVGVPAIPNTGRHSASGEESEVHDVSEQQNPPQQAKEEAPMSVTTETPTKPNAEAAKTGVEVGTDRLAARNLEVVEIQNLCASHGLDREFEQGLIREGLSLEKASLKVLAKLTTKDVTRQPAAESLERLGVSRKDLKRYSPARAMLLTMQRASFDGVEGDFHRLCEKTLPTNFERHDGGILMPLETRTQAEIDAWEERRLERHTMATNAPTKGMELVAQQTMPLVEMLQAMPIATKLGAITNFLTGPASYPRVTGGPTVQYKGENSGDVSPSDLVTGEILSKGRNTIGAVPLTRALLMQTGGAADSYAKRLLVEGESLVVDRAFFGGTGSGEQPLGLYNTPTVQTVGASNVAPTYDIITQMLAKVSRANAAFGTLGWVTTPEIAAKLMKTPEISAAGAKAIWTGPIDDGQIAGYRAIASSQAPFQMGSGADEHCFGFGNWALGHINRWGVVEVLVNPYSQALAGITLLHTYGLSDTVFTQPQGMCVATAVKNA